MELIDVPVSQLSEAPWNPRKQFDSAKLDELAESIRAQGVLEPLIVRPITSLSAHIAKAYEIVAGHRRARAAERVDKQFEVPCIVRDLTDTQALEIAIIENGQRADVHPIEEAEAIERLMLLDQAYTVEAVAAKLGVHVTTVNRKLRLLKLVNVCREAYKANAITAAHAERLAKLPADQQPQALENCFSPLLAWEDGDQVEVFEGETQMGAMIRSAVCSGVWAQLADAVAPIGELDEWLKLNARADVHDDGAKQQILSALTDADIATLSDKAEDNTNIVGQLAQLSECDEWDFSPKQAAAALVLHFSEWKEVASTGERCDRTKKGVIVHGGPLRVVDFCERSKKCAQHWPELQPKPKTAPAEDDTPKERPQWQIDQERRDAERAEWEAIRPAARLAVADQVANLKFSAALVRHALDMHKLAIIKREYGVELTEKTAASVLALAGVRDWDREGFIQDTKPLGFSLAKWEKEQKAAAKKTAKAPKAAKAKKGGKR